MKLPALLLLVATPAFAQDAGVADAPYANEDAGIHWVVSATLPDGGVLGEGFHLTKPRMQKFGDYTAVMQNENARLTFERDTAVAERDAPKTSTGFWVGMAVGAVAAAAASIAIVKLVDK